MDCLSVRGAFNAFVFGICFTLGWIVSNGIARIISSLFSAAR